jgi:hypothetical protein
MNYLFGVPLKDQLTPANVAELTSIDGSRHDFVRRQNEMILEYRLNPDRVIIRVRPVVNPVTLQTTFVLTITDLNGNPKTNLNVKFAS